MSPLGGIASTQEGAPSYIETGTGLLILEAVGADIYVPPVANPPVWTTVPDQTNEPGQYIAPYNLDDYCTRG